MEKSTKVKADEGGAGQRKERKGRAGEAVKQDRRAK